MSPATASKEKPTAAPTLTAQIESAVAELAQRKEVKRLDRESAEIAGSNVEQSIQLDVRARAIEKWCTRERERIEELIKARHAEQLAEREDAIRAVLETEIAKVEALAEELAAEGIEYNRAAARLYAIGYRSPNAPGLSGPDLLSFAPPPRPDGENPFEDQIRTGLAFRRSSLSRGAGYLLALARNPNFSWPNPSDGMAMNELRSKLPEFRLTSGTLPTSPSWPRAHTE